jgi:cytochrome c-type biogenesis protein CcmF
VARVRVDGAGVYEPSLREFPGNRQAIGTPSVRTGLFQDVYLTLVAAPTQAEGQAVIGVDVQPLVVWLWIGGGVMLLGTALAAWPERRHRRPRLPATGVGAPPPEPEDERRGLVTAAGDRQSVP